MGQFIKKIAFLSIIVSSIFLLYNSYIYSRIDWNKINHFKPLYGEEHDIIMLNSSRGINIWSDLKDHYKVETLGVGGGGIQLQQAYLEYLSLKNNSAKYIVYFIEPLCFCNSRYEIPENSKPQKFDLDFFKILINKFGINWAIKYIRNYSYVYSNQDNIKVPIESYYNRTVEVNPSKEAQEKWKRKLYSFCGKNRDIEKQKDILLETVKLANKSFKDSKFIFIITPTLLGEEPYREELLLFLEKMKKEFNIPYYDFSDKPSSLEYYHNLDHLNKKGGIYFNKEFVIPVLNKY